METRRSSEDYARKAQEKAERELERARKGVVPDVSARAAALFLNIHVETLGRWRRRNPPLGPPWRKGADGLGVRNEHISYAYEELVAWKEARQAKSHKERRDIDDLERIRQEIAELKVSLALKEAKRERASLAKKVGRMERVLAFDTLDTLTEATLWATDGQVVLGHVLTVEEADLDQALEGDFILEATVAEALGMPWVHSTARQPFADAAQQVLRQSITKVERDRTAQHERDMDLELAKGQPLLRGDSTKHDRRF